MSYEDPNEVKDKLHDAYIEGCVLIGEGETDTFDVLVYETKRFKLSLKFEVM